MCSLQSVFDDILESTKCPECGTVGMVPDGDYDWSCPNCGYEGTLESEEDEDDEDDEDEWV